MPDDELPSVNEIVDNLNAALVELKETDDYISYATLLDYYLSDCSRFSDTEKQQLLRALHEILENNLDIVHEIGWDLPELFLNFFNLEWDYVGSLLREQDSIKLIMHSFDIVAKNGNPKEVFIKSIELLTNLDYSKNTHKKEEKILDLQVYVLIELMSSSLKRINTIYPSKFLAMALSALLKTYVEYVNHSDHVRFLARWLYSFARDYIPPLKPTDYLKEHGITQKEAQVLDDDENYLQRVLLQAFLTNIVAIAFTNACLSLSMRLYNDLKKSSMGSKTGDHADRGEENVQSSLDAFLRILTLCVSFDMDMKDEFIKLKQDSCALLHKIDLTKSDDDKIQDVLKLTMNDKIESLFHPESKSIPRNNTGLLTMTALYFWHNDEIPPLSIQEAVALHLRFLTPGLLSPEFQNSGGLDACLYFDWCAISHTSPEEFKKVSHYQMVLFLQSVVYYSSIDNEPRSRFGTYTLLARVLSLIDEKVSYEFIIDTLTTAPFQNVKSAMISILKDLCLRTKPDIGSITEKLQAATISDGESTDDDKTPKPELPQRTYIQVTTERVDDIYALVREAIDETFKSDLVPLDKFKTLLGYLNFLIGLKSKFPSDKTLEIVSITERNIANVPPCEDGVNLAIATLACDSLRELLST